MTIWLKDNFISTYRDDFQYTKDSSSINTMHIELFVVINGNEHPLL